MTVIGTVSAPEIDPSSSASALTLLLGGLMVLRGRRTIEMRLYSGRRFVSALST